MKLEEALALSKVEAVLDGRKKWHKPGAQRPYFRPGFAYFTALKKKGPQKIILALGPDSFEIVWADTLRPVTRNPFEYDRNFCQCIQDKVDWEPIQAKPREWWE